MAAVNDHLAATLHALMLAFLRSTPLWGAELETVRKDRLFRAKRLVGNFTRALSSDVSTLAQDDVGCLLLDPLPPPCSHNCAG